MPEHPPLSSYRLQLHAGFGFDDATELVPYLASLGITHLYLSPVLQAVAGSLHGYDVVDHDRVSDDLGGADALVRLAETSHEHGLGVVVDVVPNHMAIPAPEHLNRPLWQVLAQGREAPTARWFDIDWDACGGRLPLPFLGDDLQTCLARGELRLDRHDGRPVVRYHDHAFPLADGTFDQALLDKALFDEGRQPARLDPEELGRLLDRQHYRLVNWRRTPELLAYRRFFDVTTLIALRVEDEEVFAPTHRLLLDLHRRGVVDGFRIDHPDGLTDPQGYLDRLRRATGDAWVVVEKIVEGDEQLPHAWACAGTTGYDGLRAVQQAFVPPTGDRLGALWADVQMAADAASEAAADGDSEPSLAAVERRAKQQVVAELLAPELDRLTRAALQAARDAGEQPDGQWLREALGELLVQLDRYRIYLRPGFPPDPDQAAGLDALVRRAKERRPELAEVFDLLHRLLGNTTTESAAGRDLVVRFQQTSGPVMAKGVEDTTFYRWHELVALDEVGGDPSDLHEATTDRLHAWARRQQRTYPAGMTTLSTHDTKRGEDVRARLLAAAGSFEGWRAAWEQVRTAAGRHGVDEPAAYLLMQTLLGAWPISPERLDAYLVKALREGKQHTTWTAPDEEYEQRVLGLAAELTQDGLPDAPATLLDRSAEAIRAVTLGTKLVQLTVPGVPDLYQGCEVVQLSLVDPDNRRVPDYRDIRARLARLDGGEPPADLADEKLLVTSRALRLRRRLPEVFRGDHRELEGTGPHVVGFVRGGRVLTLATRWPAQLARDGGFGEATVPVPDGTWEDVLTGARVAGGDRRAADLFHELPVCLLLAREEAA